MPSRRIALALAFAAWLSSPAAGSGLRDQLGEIFDGDGVNALWAVKIVSLDKGDVIFERNPRLLVMPASTMKVVTLGVAAERLGWDARFTTKVEATAPIEHGVLTGDLIVTGGGDPTIGEGDEPTRVFDEWANRLALLGLTRVDGRIVGDDDAWPDQFLGNGWAWDDLAFGYAAPLGALQFHESTAQVVITAGAQPGAPATMRIEPAGTDLVLTGHVETVAPDQPALVFSRRRPFSRTLEVTGAVPRTDRDYVRTVAVDNPTRGFVAAFRDALARAGILVSGDAVDIDDLPVKPTGPRTALLTHESPPLREIAVRLMKTSQNLIAETLLLQIGLTSDVPDPDPVVAARGAYERTLAAWGVPADALILADGSGLSRYDFTTADALVAVLSHMAKDPRHAEPFEASLPIMGVDGTLSARRREARLEGRVHAKTGSMSNVRALAGYLTTTAGERIAFAIVANNFKARSAAIDAVADRALAELLGRERPAGCCGTR
jgi:D-alanyl-D-alanine carboxypeptidase/D-alanyl-D-alanine-endopeptidase (penicillin-binding protein 4)